MSHATLRITRLEEGRGAPYRFEVWNPIERRHQSCATLEEAKGCLQSAAAAVRELWVAHDPRLPGLPEALAHVCGEVGHPLKGAEQPASPRGDSLPYGSWSI